MTVEETIYEVLWDTVNAALNLMDPPATEIPIIRSHQDAPAPNIPYVVIGEGWQWTPMGREEYPAVTDDDGNVAYKFQYEVTIPFKSANDGGSYLACFQRRLKTRTISQLLQAGNLGVLRTGTITPNPRPLDGVKWSLEYSMDLVFAIAVETTENIGWILDVDLTNNIGES